MSSAQCIGDTVLFLVFLVSINFFITFLKIYFKSLIHFTDLPLQNNLLQSTCRTMQPLFPTFL